MNKKKHILIVEDNSDLREIFKMMLSEDQYEISFARDGLAGILQFVDHQPDLVILDIMLPEMDGIEVLQAIRDQTSSVVPILVISNLSDEHVQTRAMDAGASGYMIKSELNEKLLKETIASFL